MASVVASVVGGTPKRVTAETVTEAREALGLASNYTAAVDGEPADGDTLLSDEQYVTFSAAVKGGKR